MATRKAKPTPARDAETIRKAALADPNTAGIAKKLGVPLEAYVEQVVHFALNPKAEPSVYVVEDDDLRGMGLEPPDGEAMGRYLVEAAAVTRAADETSFTDAKSKKAALAQPPAAQAHGKTDEKLKKDVEKQLRTRRGDRG